jgi:uncharacterized protein YcaQ
MSGALAFSAKQARELALHAQGLTNASSPKAATDVLQLLGAIQLDTISVLARSHELIYYARTPKVTRAEVESTLWSAAKPADTFEYWSHAACVLPTSMYPLFEFRRRSFARRGVRWHEVPSTKVLHDIKRQLADGPLNASELGGAKKAGDWWSWSETKVGVEWLLDIGEVVCTNRVGWRRQYCLTENAIASELLTTPDDQDCLRELILAGARTLGIGTRSDIADVHRLGSPHVTQEQFKTAFDSVLESGELVQVSVTGWEQPGYLLKDCAELPNSKSVTTLLSPFDSLVWYRERMERIFGMRYRIEAYTPAAKRQYGYFAMPVLHNGQLIARVDPGKTKNQVVAKKIVFESTDPTAAQVSGVALALHKAKTSLKLESVALGQVVPEAKRDALQSELNRLN